MTKQERYEHLLPQIAALCKDEPDLIAKMANISALLHSEMGFWWTGFYRVVDGELLLGPFQGPIACTHIGYGRGVCGTAWQQGTTLIVDDVELFPGHIACSSASKSEIVVPLWMGNIIVAVLDIDSMHLASFDNVDKHYLELVAQLVSGSNI